MHQNEGPQLLKWVCWWNPDKSGGWVRKAGVWDVWVTGLRKRGNSSHLQWCPRWVSFGIMILSTLDRPMGEAFTGPLSRGPKGLQETTDWSFINCWASDKCRKLLSGRQMKPFAAYSLQKEKQHSTNSYSVQLCLTVCDPMDCSTPCLPVYHQLPELLKLRSIEFAIQPSHPLSSPSPPALNLSQHQGLFKWVSSSHQVAKGLEFQLLHQSFQWIFGTDFL